MIYRIVPKRKPVPSKKKSKKKVRHHPFFGMSKKPATKKSVEQEMECLRGKKVS